MSSLTDETATRTARPNTRRGLPFSLLIGSVTGLAVYVVSLAALRDVDLYWHLRAGMELATGTGPRDLGGDWAFAPVPAEWVSTQWLFELAGHLLQAVGGWAAIAAFRVVTCAVAVAVLAWTTLRGRPRSLAAFPYLVGVIALTLASQERPQQISYIGAAALGGVLVVGLTQGRLPRWWILLPVTALWANVHGGWVLVPATLAVIAAGLALDNGLSERLAWQAAGLSGLAIAAGALTPSGLQGISAPLTFSRAAASIHEWQPTEPMSRYGILTVMMLALLALGWARSQRVPPSELLTCLLLFAFSWLAWRNVAPGLVLLAPLTAHRLAQAFPGVHADEPRWSVPLGISAAALLTGLALAGLGNQQHLPVERLPIGLATQIDQLPGNQRVLNDYTTAGVVLWFGPEDARVAIDGRADLYGAEYIDAYLALNDLNGEWEALLAELDPSSALVEEESALARMLQIERNWVVVGRESGFVLLTPSEGGS